MAETLDQPKRFVSIAVSRPSRGPMASLSVLGTMSISIAGREIAIRTRKARAILAYLGLHEGLRETRERLVGLFWSESDEERARGSLRQTVRELRVVFAEHGYHGFYADKLTVGLERARIDVDLWAILRAVEVDQQAHPALLNTERLADALLPGLDDLDPAFRVWLVAKRRAVHDRLLRVLEDRLRSEALGSHMRLKVAEAIMNLDPTHEDSCRYVIRERARTGDIGGALRAYKTLWDVLDADFDTEPSSETQRLIAAVKTGELEQITSAASLPASPSPSAHAAQSQFDPAARPPGTTSSKQQATRIELAVGAVELSGVESDKGHLVQGFRQHLIACLVRFREWYVTDKPVRSEHDAGKSPPASAHYAIEMTAYQSGPVLNLVLTLKDSGSSVYIWSERFELKVEVWFEMQQRIVRRLATAFNVSLSAERLARLAGEPDVSLDIYDRWLRGQALLAPFSPVGRRRAAEIFAGIIREAPSFSPAYSSLAQINNGDHIAFPGTFRSRDKERQTLELAKTAVQLDPMDSRAHLCLAWSQIMAKRYDMADAPIRLACDLNENDPWTLTSAAHVLAFCGDFSRARDLASQALDLSPMPSPIHWAYQATNRFLWGDYEGCLIAAIPAGDILSGLPAWIAAALFHLGRKQEATEQARTFIERIRSKWFGSGPATDELIMQWLLHLYPIRRREDWERLRDGLAGAGVPVDGMDHHGW